VADLRPRLRHNQPMNANSACVENVEARFKALGLQHLHPDERLLVVALCTPGRDAADAICRVIMAIRHLATLSSEPEFAGLTQEERNRALALFVSGKSLADVRTILRGLIAKRRTPTPAHASRRPSSKHS
jgi:hypothetical protein